MKKSILRLFAILLLGGCAKPADDTAKSPNPSPDTKVAATETPSSQTTAKTSDGKPADAAPAVDAEKLLAATLATAKADNKRVIVHLGAPW